MKHGFLLLATGLSFVVGSAQIFAASDRLVSQLDINGNGMLDNPDEVYLGLAYKLAPDKTDIATYRQQHAIPDAAIAEPAIAALYRTFVKRHGVKAAYEFSDVDNDEFGITKTVYPSIDMEALKARPTVWEKSLQIRRDRDQLDSPQADPALFSDVYAQGALFSYGHNFNTGIDQWIARGVIAYSAARIDNPYYQRFAPDGKTRIPRERTALRSLGLDLSVAFDKVDTGGGDSDEVDSLDFGVGVNADWRIPDNPFRFESVTTTLTGHYVTDFGFGKEVGGATLDVVPTFGWRGYQKFDGLFGTYRAKDEERSYLDFRWSIGLHAEAGSVMSPETEPGLQGYDSFCRLGGKVSLQLQPFPEALDHRLNVYASYLHYESTTQDAGASHLFHASLEYLIPVAGGIRNPQNTPGTRTADDILITFKIEYQNGEIPFVQERDNSVLLGIGVLY
jgi:hypothetical protein